MTRKIKYKEPSHNLIKMSSPNHEKPHRSSLGMDKFIGEYYYISLDKLIAHKNQARKHFNEEELTSLAETIKEHGIRQPLSIAQSTTDTDKYEVISGERRLRAAKLAGLSKVPCIILSSSDSKEEIALIENIHRSDLHPIELARGLKKLIDDYGWGGQTDLEKRLGIAQSKISTLLKFLDLSIDIQDICIAQNYSGRDKLLALLKEENDDIRKRIVIGQKGKTPSPTTKFSVVRVLCDDDGLRIQKNAIKKLSFEQKQELINELNKIISELETQI